MITLADISDLWIGDKYWAQHMYPRRARIYIPACNQRMLAHYHTWSHLDEAQLSYVATWKCGILAM